MLISQTTPSSALIYVLEAHQHIEPHKTLELCIIVSFCVHAVKHYIFYKKFVFGYFFVKEKKRKKGNITNKQTKPPKQQPKNNKYTPNYNKTEQKKLTELIN